MIIDYSTARPSIPLLKSAGVTAVGRYIGWDSVPGYPSIGKNITKTEADALIAAHIEIFLAFEYAADAAVHGFSQGHDDGTLATTQLHALGAPADMAVYFAADFDVPDYAPTLSDTPGNALAKLGPVGQYFQGIHATHPAYEVAAYGDYYVLRRLVWAGLVIKCWQTTAWSGNQIDMQTQVVLLQEVGGVPASLASLGVDVNIREHTATVADFGQWPRPAGPKPPVPPPVPQGGGMGYPYVLDNVHEVAYVLPIPAGKTKVILYCDPLGIPVGSPHAPKFRVGFGPAWSKHEVTPTWDVPAELTVPPGEQRITISRMDNGIVPVTVDFA